MNIWIFNHYATAPYHVGGTRHYDLALELVKKGHNVTIIASSFNHFLKQETIEYPGKSYFLKEEINGVQYLWIKTIKYEGMFKRLLNIIDYTRKAHKIAKKMIKDSKPDVIIGSSVHPFAAYIGYKISKKSNSIFYFEERDLWPQTFVDFGKISKNNPITKVLYWFENLLYKKSDRIIILFDRAVEYVCSRGIERNKVLYIPNGVSLDKYRDLRIDKSIKNLFPIEKNIVIYTGSHGIANDLYPLIETAKILTKKNNKIHFVLVGNGPLKEKLKSMAKEHRLKNITFLDPVPKDKIPLILSFADLSFISIKNSPLYKWGFSMNKLYDYMAAGLPIMIHSSKEVLGELIHVNGIKLAENPNELASKIIEIIDDKEYKKHAGNNLRQFVETNYSWEKLVVNLEESMILDLRERDSQVEKSI